MINLKEQHSKFVKLYSFSSGATSPTNIKLIEEMISHLDDEIFKNPNSKFLDPCAGTGTFGVVLYDKLLKYHDSKWILKNMIFMVDTSRVNCDILKKLGFVNVYNDDFLKLKLNMKFDAIVGNPPYNDERGIQGGGKNLYSKFIKKSFNLINENGIVSFVTNAGYLKTTNNTRTEILEKLLSKNLVYLNIGECKKWFPNVGGAMVFSYFVWKNNNDYTKTKCVTQLNGESKIHIENIDLSQMTWIPRILTNEVISIIEKTNTHTFEFTRVDNIETKNIDLKNKIGFKRLNHLVKPYNVKASSTFDNGTYIITNSYNIDEDLDFFNSKLFSFLNVIHRYDGVIYHNVLSNFGKPDVELTKSEINFIENYVG